MLFDDVDKAFNVRFVRAGRVQAGGDEKEERIGIHISVRVFGRRVGSESTYASEDESRVDIPAVRCDTRTNCHHYHHRWTVVGCMVVVAQQATLPLGDVDGERGVDEHDVSSLARGKSIQAFTVAVTVDRGQTSMRRDGNRENKDSGQTAT